MGREIVKIAERAWDLARLKPESFDKATRFSAVAQITFNRSEFDQVDGLEQSADETSQLNLCAKDRGRELGN